MDQKKSRAAKAAAAARRRRAEKTNSPMLRSSNSGAHASPVLRSNAAMRSNSPVPALVHQSGAHGDNDRVSPIPSLSLSPAPWPPEALAEIQRLKDHLKQVTQERDSLAALLNSDGSNGASNTNSTNQLSHTMMQNAAYPRCVLSLLFQFRF